MRLQFRTSVGSAQRSFMVGRTIDVPARTVADVEAWLDLEPEFRAWLASGVVVMLDGPGLEVADQRPLTETATLPTARPFRGRGRDKRPSVSRAGRA